MTPTVFIVGANKGGVGKTTVTRLLLDYFTQNAIEFKAFDTEAPDGGLQRFHAQSTVVDLSKSTDQMKVFDNVSPTAVTVIDIRAGLLTPTLKTLSEIGFLDMAKAGKLRVVVLHVVGPAAQSLDEVAPVIAALAGSRHIPVANHVNDTEFVAPDGAIKIGKLDEAVNKHVDEVAMGFADFIKSGASFVRSGYVRKWMGDAFAEFDKAKLNVLS
jgi:MinD-like ATPase involved in chromosome partitioning or flagellar assembly